MSWVKIAEKSPATGQNWIVTMTHEKLNLLNLMPTPQIVSGLHKRNEMRELRQLFTRAVNNSAIALEGVRLLSDRDRVFLATRRVAPDWYDLLVKERNCK
jgi:hypothetical protein